MRWFGVVAIVVVALVVGFLGRVAIDELWEGDVAEVGEVPLSPNPEADFTILAVGDSFISGEGAASFWPGTNEENNGCRRTWTAHPYQVASDYAADLRFVACSGARISHILSDSQYPDSPEDVAGGRPQLDYIREAAADADIVLLSIGGNDAGFGEIVESCVRPDRSPCHRDPARWLDPLPGLEPSLSAAYAEIERAAPNAQLFVLTYPQPLGPRHCSASLLDSAEFDFLSQQFIPALNNTIMRAAEQQQVPVIDLSNSFRGLRLCEVVPQKSALNRVAFPRTHNSFHPNEIGHTLISSIVVRHLLLAGYPVTPATDEVTVDVPITLATDEPPDAEDPDAPSATPPAPGPGSLPTSPDATVPSATIIEDGPSADCQAQPTSPIRLDPRTTSIRISEAASNTEVCYRFDGGDWHVTPANAQGILDIPIDDPGRPLAVDTAFVDRTDSSVTLSFLLSE